MASIPLPNSTTDVYSYGFDKALNRVIDDNSTGVVYDSVGETLNAGSVLSGGNLTLKTLSIGGLVKQVAPGDDIQSAINAISAEGGGTVQLLADTYILKTTIQNKNGVFIRGAGRDLTILDFSGLAFGLECKGTSGSIIENWGLLDFTLQNSNATAGLDIDFADFWRMDNVRITSCDQDGVRIKNCNSYKVANVRSDNNTGDGFYFTSDDNRDNQDFSFSNCTADTNTGNGFSFYTASGLQAVRRATFINCESSSNTLDGWDFASNVTFAGMDFILTACRAISNTVNGFDIENSVADILFLGCKAETNGGDGFEIDGQNISSIGCDSNSNTGADFAVESQNTRHMTFIGNATTTLASNTSSVEFTGNDENMQSWGNKNDSTKTSRILRRMQNSDSGTMPSGAAVIIASNSGGEHINTTTTNGDNKAFGMVLGLAVAGDSGLSAGQNGYILAEGYTSLLYANNSATSISIGDWLSTYSHAYYAKKAVAGDMAFAIALEAPTTSTAQIDALLVSPRLI